MSILTTAAASTLPGLPIVWKDFQAANQPKRKSSQLKLLNPSRDHVESVIAYNTPSKESPPQPSGPFLSIDILV